MLESTPYVQPWYGDNFSALHSFNALMKRGGDELVYLFLPEDTTDRVARRHSDTINLRANSTRGAVKTVLWIAVSIAASVAVGQLQ